MIVHYDQSPVGTGKTRRVIQKAVSHQGRWLFALQRHTAIEELRLRIGKAAQSHNTAPKLEVIRSEKAKRGYSVRQEVEALPEKYDRASHVIAMCTHAALTMTDIRGFAGWHLVVDELPPAFSMQEIGSQRDEAFFREHFALEHVHGAWSKISCTDAGRKLDGSILQQDDSHQHLRLLHRRVLDSERITERHVVCNLADWSEMTKPKLRWTWWDYFSVRELAAFESVQFLANGFSQSFPSRLWKLREPDVKWREIKTHDDRPLQRRGVTITWFHERQASKNMFAGPKGRGALERIAAYIAEDAGDAKLIWSGNREVVEPLTKHLSMADYLTPKQAGANCWMDRTRAVMMYATKPSPSVGSVLDALGVEQQDWIESEEYETILQFVTRTSVRDVSSREHVYIYVFDRDQAKYLMRFFEAQPHIYPECRHVDLGLDLAAGKSGPKVQSLTPTEIEVAQIERRRKRAIYAKNARARQRAA